MARKKLRTDVRAHSRRGFTTRRGVYRSKSWVDRHTRYVKDRGAKGRGKKIIKIKKEGTLGGAGFFSKSRATQERILRGAVNKFGERSVQGKLQAIAVFNKRVNPRLSREATRLRSWVAKTYD